VTRHAAHKPQVHVGAQLVARASRRARHRPRCWCLLVARSLVSHCSAVREKLYHTLRRGLVYTMV
jgi:hypothetical protein